MNTEGGRLPPSVFGLLGNPPVAGEYDAANGVVIGQCSVQVLGMHDETGKFGQENGCGQLFCRIFLVVVHPLDCLARGSRLVGVVYQGVHGVA